MARTNDIGPYETGNVRICLQGDNAREALRGVSKSAKAKRNLRKALAKPETRIKRGLLIRIPFTKAERSLIKRQYSGGSFTHTELAAQFGCCAKTIGNVINDIWCPISRHIV